MVAIGPDPTTELPFQEYSHLRCRLALADSFLDLIFGTFVVVLMAPFSDSVTDNTRGFGRNKRQGQGAGTSLTAVPYTD